MHRIMWRSVDVNSSSAASHRQQVRYLYILNAVRCPHVRNTGHGQLSRQWRNNENSLLCCCRYRPETWRLATCGHGMQRSSLYSALQCVWYSSLKRSGMARVNERSHSFTCQPHVYPQVEWAILHLLPSRIKIQTTQLQLAATLWWFTAAPKPLKIQVFGCHPAPRGRTAPIF